MSIHLNSIHLCTVNLFTFIILIQLNILYSKQLIGQETLEATITTIKEMHLLSLNLTDKLLNFVSDSEYTCFKNILHFYVIFLKLYKRNYLGEILHSYSE